MFCSWTRNAPPETRTPTGVAPATSAAELPVGQPELGRARGHQACAQALCASMWIAEFVKNVITGHIRTPKTNATPGQR